MTTSGDRRHLIWLALGVLVPGAVLLALGIMLVRQEAELEQRRGADEEALRSRMVADSLQRGLEAAAAGLEANASTRRYPAERTLLQLGSVVQDRYEPPRPAPDEAWGDPGFDRLLRQADQLFNQGRYAAAIRSYRRRLDTDTDSSRIALLQHLTARAAIAGGDTVAAVASANEALFTKPEFRDDFGPPISFYAADFLLSHGLADGQVCEVLSSAVTGRDWLELSHYRYAEELMERGGCPSLPDQTQSEYRLLEWMRSQRVAPISSGDRTISNWRSAPGSWLVRFADQGVTQRQSVVAVRVDSLQRLISLPAVTGFGVPEAGAPSLAPLFPTISVAFAPESAPRISRAVLVGGGLFLILAMTVFGGLLILRDIRREARVSRLRSQFVSSVSHEVRTPLTSIRLFAEAMLEYGAGSEAQVRKNLEVIAYESGRLTRMLNNVLETSRIERGAVKYTLIPGDLCESVQSAVDAVQYAYDRRGVSLTVDSESVEFPFDSDAVEQAVVNLLSNALKYGEGSDVEVRCGATPEGASISVRDGGSGIAPEEQERVFERFVQGTNAGNSTGVGLGLALVKHIMEGHGGTVSLESSPGRGSLFTMQFPRSNES